MRSRRSRCSSACRTATWSEAPRRGGPIFNIAVMGFAVMCHSGWACGIGRRLLDELSAKARGGVGRDVQATMDRGAMLDTRQHTMIRLALAHGKTWMFLDLVDER